MLVLNFFAKIQYVMENLWLPGGTIRFNGEIAKHTEKIDALVFIIFSSCFVANTAFDSSSFSILTVNCKL